MAAIFDGVDDAYQLAGESTLRYEYTQAFSGHCWIRKDTSSGFCIMGKAQNSPPGAQQRGWAFNTENIAGNLSVSFHLVNNATVPNHAYLEANQASGTIIGLVPGLWVPVGFTYNGNGLVSGMTLYGGGLPLVGIPGADNLSGNTILVNGVPVRIGGFDTEFWAGRVAGVTIVPAELSAADMAELGDIRNFNVDPDTFLATPADVWLPLRRQGGVVDLTDYSGNGHDASVATGAPAVADDPRLVFDTFNTANITSTGSLTLTPNGNVTAAAVIIVQNVSSTDLITGVTYGGVAMTRIPLGFAQDTAGEPGCVYAYFLNSGVPQGAQTVSVTVASGTDAKTFWAIAFNSGTPVGFVTSAIQQGDAANPSVTLSTLGTWVGFVLNILFSGQNAPGSITPGAGYSKLGGGRDFGNQSGVAMASNLTGANVTSGWTATIEDVAMVAFALEASLQPREGFVNHNNPGVL